MTADDERLTAMQVVLRLEKTVSEYILAHRLVHTTLVAPGVIEQRHVDVDRDLLKLQTTVESHERTIQRIIGALVLISAIGASTLILVILRMAGAIA